MAAAPAKPPEEAAKAGTSMNPRKSYAAVVEEKQSERMKLNYVEPKMRDGKPVIEIPEKMTQAGRERWRHTIIAYVLGQAPTFREMTNYVNSVWKGMGKVQVHGMGQGVFVFQMENEEAKLEVLEKGPWSFQRRTLILRPWHVGMTVDKPAVQQLPVWVRFPKLPLDLWTDEGLSMIASHIGKPIHADRTTTTQSNLAYARVSIEVNAESILPTELPIKYENGGSFVQQVKYEWMPEVCSTCKKFGHEKQRCNAIVTHKYVPIVRDQRKGKEVMENEALPITPKLVAGMTLTPYAKALKGKEEVRGKTIAMVNTPKPRQEMQSTNKFSPLEVLDETEEESEAGDEDEMQLLGKGVCQMIAKMISTSGKKVEKQQGTKKGGRRKLEASLLIEAKPQ